MRIIAMIVCGAVTAIAAVMVWCCCVVASEDDDANGRG